MSALRRSLALAFVLTASATPGAALASGGGGGGGSTPPPPAPTIECDFSLDGPTADGGFLGTLPVKNAACLRTVTTVSAIRLYDVTVGPGWTYTVKSDGGGTNSRVAVDFSNPATGERAEARIEFGKTVVH
jgi:hypothetical protein